MSNVFPSSATNLVRKKKEKATRKSLECLHGEKIKFKINYAYVHKTKMDYMFSLDY